LGFTLVEVLIVVVIMAVLAAAILPQFSDSARDAKVSAAAFNLQILRKQIVLYRAHHDGRLPSASLAELISRTDAQGTIGTGASHIFGPYLGLIPENPLTGHNAVRTTTASPPAAASGASDAGWLYHAASGGVWIDHDSMLAE
jgi:prepilin-type N-terminal cleavage/methylation domain-containing protein